MKAPAATRNGTVQLKWRNGERGRVTVMGKGTPEVMRRAAERHNCFPIVCDRGAEGKGGGGEKGEGPQPNPFNGIKRRSDRDWHQEMAEEAHFGP